MTAQRRRNSRLPASPPDAPRVRLLTSIGSAAIIVGIVITFANILRAPLIYDDASAVRDNISIRQLWPLTIPLNPPPSNNPMSGRPLANLTMAIDYAIGGLDPVSYHATNIALHITCALLMFIFVRRTAIETVAPTQATLLGLLAALLWAVHPLNSEPVDHISARTESLMALCYLLTLYAAIRARTSLSWTVIAVGACAAGMACKESMVTAPLMVLLYDRAMHGKRWTATVRERRWFYTGLASTWLVFASVNWLAPRGHATSLVADAGLIGPATPFTYALNQARIIPHYFRLAVWPTALVLDYGVVRPVGVTDVAGYLLLLLVAVAFIVWLIVVKPKWGFLGAWIVVTLAPASSIVPVYTAVGAERRMYLPMMAVIVGAVLIGGALTRRFMKASSAAIIGSALAVALIGLLMITTVRRNAEYSSALTMWSTVVERWPHGRAHYNLAIALKEHGRAGEALDELRRAAGDYPEALSVLGAELIEQGKTDEGIAALQSFIRQRPAHINVIDARRRIAEAVFARSDYARAIPEYRAYLTMAPQAVRAWTNLGICLAATGEPAEAVAAFRRAVALQPGIGETHRNLANALLDNHQFADAEHEARETIRLSPGDTVAREILELAIAGAAHRVR